MPINPKAHTADVVELSMRITIVTIVRDKFTALARAGRA